MNGFPPTLAALLLILITAVLSAVAVGALAKPPPSVALALPTAVALPKLSPTPASLLTTGPLTGLPTLRPRATRRPIAAMIDNLVDARPQSGLGEASVVWEAPVESGITRLMAVFLEHDATSLGPIRSARPYFLDWAAAYHPLFVHDGGSPAAQREVRLIRGLTSVDAYHAGTTFHRAAGKSAPHNLFTSTPAIRTLAGLRNWVQTASVPAIPHRRNPVQSINLTGRSVTLSMTSPGVAPLAAYTVSYRYDPAGNAYLRSVNGQPAVDALNGRQIETANVVVLVTTMKPIPRDPLSRISIRTLGSGPAVVLEGGREIKASWSKPTRLSPLTLTDASSSSVRLNPGTTWIEVVTAGSYRVK